MFTFAVNIDIRHQFLVIPQDISYKYEYFTVDMFTKMV